MRQLLYWVELTESNETLTGHAGLALLVELCDSVFTPEDWEELAHALGLKNGQTARRHFISLLQLHIAGGVHVSDLDELRQDEGLARLLTWLLSSPTQMKYFLYQFHQTPDGQPISEEQDAEWSKQGTAQIRPEGPGLRVLDAFNRRLVAAIADKCKVDTLTVEVDATVVESSNKRALWTYKGTRGYQPQMAYVPELGVWVKDQFRDGNVPSNYEVTPFVQNVVFRLQGLARHIRLRADSAYYNDKLLSWLDASGVEFVISAPISPSLKKTILALDDDAWSDLPDKDSSESTGKGKSKSGSKPSNSNSPDSHSPDSRPVQVAEVCYVPDAPRNRTKHGQPLRYIVIRRPIKLMDTSRAEAQVPLFDRELEDSFHTAGYCYFARVTNTDWPAHQVVFWHNLKQGQIERAHDILKNDFAAASLPFVRFGSNAAWWRMGVIGANMIQLFKLLVLPKSLRSVRLKRLRLLIFNVAARVIRHARKTVLRLKKSLFLASIIQPARSLFATLQAPPPLPP